MQLSNLLPNYPFTLPTVTVQGLKLDNRKITNGDVFCAVPGYTVDGREFIGAAISAGAVAVFAEGDSPHMEERDGVPVIFVPRLAQELSAIAGRFFQEPSKQLKLTGVTGTNGKTTVSHLVAQLWELIEPPAAVIGTIGSGLMTQLLPEVNTTPDAITVQQRLASFLAEGAQSVAMEVSSHALVQGRVEALVFDTVIATNLSRDHLDYHGDMDNYAAAKARLFTGFTSTHRVFNADDAIVSSWAGNDDVFFSMRAELAGEECTLVALDRVYDTAGASFDVVWGKERTHVESALLGEFNVANVLAAMAALLAAGHSLAEVAACVPNLRAVPGRMETFPLKNGALVIVDYAHTPDALDHVLKAARNHCEGRLWCVFGCGGDRDRGKRPQMGQVASTGADCVVVTDDNPRTEDPQAIIEDIISGMSGSAEVIRRPGRTEAIQETLAKTATGDVVVLAGKGHETYQIIGNRTHDYNERAYVARLAEDLRHD
ncbi:MAG: UDP-N-acetylmuramoyl-L-alanyl-D-glutamate--2,6-diaminopimelate ligase [Idiomarina sp.]|nr:UDP-N-acetylmuramoyl-L-alanyl-D-glutamate--2,6-diaminopimelate ligase [Idiomarina sp.]